MFQAAGVRMNSLKIHLNDLFINTNTFIDIFTKYYRNR